MASENATRRGRSVSLAGRSAQRIRRLALTGVFAHTALTIHARPVTAQVSPSFQLVPVGSIGVLDGDPDREFGEIIGMATDESRDLVILLDRLAARVSVFSSDGRFIAATGRSGAGPGEFAYPRAVDLHGDLIEVWDPGNTRISSYVLEADTLRLSNELSTRFQGWDFCVIDGHRFVLKYHQGGLVQDLDTEGNLVDSFGAPFRDDDPRMAGLTDFGLIACDRGSTTVFVVSGSASNAVRAYSTNGDLRWESIIPDMVPAAIAWTERGGLRWSTPEGHENSHTNLSLVVLPGGMVLVQFAPDAVGVRESQPDVESVIFDASSGRVLDERDDLPRVGHADKRYAYAHHGDPFPRVIVYEIRGGG